MYILSRRPADETSFVRAGLTEASGLQFFCKLPTTNFGFRSCGIGSEGSPPLIPPVGEMKSNIDLIDLGCSAGEVLILFLALSWLHCLHLYRDTALHMALTRRKHIYKDEDHQGTLRREGSEITSGPLTFNCNFKSAVCKALHIEWHRKILCIFIFFVHLVHYLFVYLVAMLF